MALVIFTIGCSAAPAADPGEHFGKKTGCIPHKFLMKQLCVSGCGETIWNILKPSQSPILSINTISVDTISNLNVISMASPIYTIWFVQENASCFLGHDDQHVWHYWPPSKALQMRLSNPTIKAELAESLRKRRSNATQQRREAPDVKYDQCISVCFTHIDFITANRSAQYCIIIAQDITKLYLHACIHACVHTDVHTRIHMHAHTHTHTRIEVTCWKLNPVCKTRQKHRA